MLLAHDIKPASVAIRLKVSLAQNEKKGISALIVESCAKLATAKHSYTYSTGTSMHCEEKIRG